MTSYRHVKIPVQYITSNQAKRIKQFLLDQPRWRFLDKDETAENTNRYAKKGVAEQHWLWM